MYEQFGFETMTPLAASAVLGLLLGVIFGAIALCTRFCLRRALVSDDKDERKSAARLWVMALAFGVLGTQLGILAGWIDFTGHRFHAAEIPVLLIALGGLLFGAGMVLTRGCASRLSVLAGSGNLRALLVLLIFSITAHATLKGFLAPLRTALAGYTLDTTALISMTQFELLVFTAIAIAVTAIVTVWVRPGANRSQLVGGAVIGLLVPIAWVGTGLVLQDDFDPIAFQSLSFTSSASEWLFWGIASTSIGAGFGVGLIFGVLLGSAATAVVTRKFQWVSFSSPGQTGRYAVGGALMGIGGVFAGGCTVGAGLSGLSSLSISALLALISIVTGALVTDRVLKLSWSGGIVSYRMPSL